MVDGFVQDVSDFGVSFRSVRLRFDTWCLAHSVSRLQAQREGWQEVPMDDGALVISCFTSPSKYFFEILGIMHPRMQYSYSA